MKHARVFASTGPLAVQQRADCVARLPDIVERRHVPPPHPGGVRRGRRPFLHHGGERVRQGDLRGAPRRGHGASRHAR